MYTLILTQGEREAFNWIGDRYSNGNDMRNVIKEYPVNPDDSWDSTGPVAFDLPEHAAWEIKRFAEEDDESFPCFSEELTIKMLRFLEQIV